MRTSRSVLREVVSRRREIAQQAMALIGTLFAVEKKAKDLSDEERLALRLFGVAPR